MARLTANVMVVMFCPNATSSTFGAEEVGSGCVGFGQNGVALLARRESAFVVGVAPSQIVGHGVDRPTRYLGSTRAVQIHVWPAVMEA